MPPLWGRFLSKENLPIKLGFKIGTENRSLKPFPPHIESQYALTSGGSRSLDSETMRSVSGNDYDCDDNECRDQRKSAIECFRSGLCDIVERRHSLRWRLQFANEPANISGLHWI